MCHGGPPAVGGKHNRRMGVAARGGGNQPNQHQPGADRSIDNSSSDSEPRTPLNFRRRLGMKTPLMVNCVTG